MTHFSHFLSVVFLVAILPGALAGPACSRKFFKSSECISKCKSGWGWSARTMGSNPWGGVMKQPASNETLDDVLSKACGFEPTPTPSQSQPLANVQTGSVTFSSAPTASPSAIAPATLNVTLSVSTFALNTSSYISPPSTSTSIKPFLTSSPSTSPTSTTRHTTIEAVASATTKAAAPTTTQAEAFTTTQAAAPTTTKSAAPTTTTAGSVSSSSSDSTSSSDIQAYLSSHNTVRAAHGAADLTWSDNLASKAQTWADGCVFQHSGGSLGPFGENLAAGTGSSYDIQAAVESWTDEVSEYDPSDPVASHFTQVVWKSTTQVGCAVQSCDGIFAASFGPAKFFVCEYSPAGNVIGEFAANVQV